MKNMITIFGTMGQLECNSFTGEVTGSDNAYEDIAVIDLDEYRQYYGVIQLPDTIDILDFGYTDKEGVYTEPAKDWRQTVKAEKYHNLNTFHEALQEKQRNSRF